MAVEFSWWFTFHRDIAVKNLASVHGAQCNIKRAMSFIYGMATLEWHVDFEYLAAF